MNQLKPVIVGNWENWGKLVKTWATGQDYVKDGNKYPRPATLEELKQQAQTAKCDLQIPERITKLDMFQRDSDTLVVKLPPADMIKMFETQLQQLGSVAGGAEYPLPDFYDVFWSNYDEPAPKWDADTLLRIQTERIGEYTINNCQ